MERVFAEIRETVDKEAELLVSRARRVAEREMQHASEEAEAILSVTRENAEREARLREERATARAVVEPRKCELAQQQEFVQTVFDIALRKVRDMPRDDAYRTWIQSLLRRGLAAFHHGKAEVFCNDRDTQIVAQLVASSSATMSDKPVEIAGGVILKSADGRLSVDCSAEAELERAREELRDETLARLHLDDQ